MTGVQTCALPIFDKHHVIAQVVPAGLQQYGGIDEDSLTIDSAAVLLDQVFKTPADKWVDDGFEVVPSRLRFGVVSENDRRQFRTADFGRGGCV